MKTNLILLAFVLLEINQLVAQTTPRGNPVTSHQAPEIWSYTDKLNLDTAYSIAYPNAILQGTASSTSTYNCHSYAWNMSEGGPTCWINTPADDTYWTDQSYVETTEAYASKISYYDDDHSARQTATQGMYISKWGNKVLMLHARDYGPSDYHMTYRKYYKLNPGISGTVTPLCVNVERTFTSNTSISGSTYSWTRSTSLLDEVSGAGTTSYRVKAKSGSGKAWLRLQITTPSGEVATTGYKYLWVGKQTLDDVTGPGYYPYEGCTNTEYSFSVSPLMDPLSQGTVTWSIIPSNGYIYPYYTNYAAITFYYPHAGYRVLANVQNACGTNYAETSIYIEDCYYFSISPNPASDIVTINRVAASEETDGKTIMMSSDDANTTYDIQIVDYYGSLHLQTTKSGDSFTLPVSNLKNGNYTIQITNGNKTSNLKLVVKH
jgi:hypothetical protein